MSLCKFLLRKSKAQISVIKHHFYTMPHCFKVFILVKRSVQHNFDCLNSSEVYKLKLPAEPVDSNMARAFRPYPNDHVHKLAFLAQSMPNNTRVSAFHWSARTCNGDDHWPPRGLSRGDDTILNKLLLPKTFGYASV